MIKSGISGSRAQSEVLANSIKADTILSGTIEIEKVVIDKYVTPTDVMKPFRKGFFPDGSIVTMKGGLETMLSDRVYSLQIIDGPNFHLSGYEINTLWSGVH